MKLQTYAYLAVGLLLLAAPAGALIPDNITISASPVWLTAGGDNAATITVQVKNSTSPLEGVGVDFDVDGTYGSISPLHAVTDSDGKAMADFRPGTVAGTAKITATVPYEGPDEPLVGSIDLQIDHTIPHAIAGLWYKPEVTAGGETDITVRMEDRYGNVVDSRREDALGISLQAENVTFMVGSPGGGAAFAGGRDKIPVPVDENGNATARLRVDTVAGENMVFLTFSGKVGPRSLIIAGLANGEPSKIYQIISPKVEDPNPDYHPELPLGEQFTITYILYDEYGNPAGDRQIRVDVQPISGFLKSETLSTRTNSMGRAQITYRSSKLAGVAEILATAIDNSSVSCKQKVGFYSTDPTGMVLTAVPQTIASRDVNGSIISSIKAKIIDSKGNPIQKENVSFKIIEVDGSGYLMTNEPEISNGTFTSGKGGMPLIAMTDEDGFATINFHPGAFTRDTSNLLYRDMASGNATVQAEWSDKKEDTVVSFRNYPYLSVNVTVEPQVFVNSSVNVTIQLIGDGWALQTRPVDVVLCTDRSGSMLKNTTYSGKSTNSPKTVVQESIDDRMVHAMRAAKVFVSQMQLSKDRIGLVSFGQKGTANLNDYGNKFWAGNDYVWQVSRGVGGWTSDSSDDNAYIATHYKNPKTYSGAATRDLELTWTHAHVNSAIDNLIPCGGTPMREGLYQSVRMILEGRKSRIGAADPVEAIVLLTDGVYDSDQNPEGGKGSKSLGNGVRTSSVIDYAKDNGIKIFTIALGSEPSHGDLKSYANMTGGTFYSATAGDDLTQVYADIATKLQEAAGVNTTMDLAFDRVMINSTPTVGVFDYDPVDPISTRMVQYWTDNKTVIWGPKWEDQRGDWEGDQILTFDVGDIYLDQTWETTFRLRVLKEGNIDIFGNGSIIRFNGTVGKTELLLPHTFITASLDLNESGIVTADIWLTPNSLNTGDPGILVPSWNLSYTGDNPVTQKVMYQFSQDDVWWDGNWHEADTLHHSAGGNINDTYSSRLNLGEKEGWYRIRVFARENTPDDDGASDEITWMEPILVGACERAYIRIS